MVAAIEDVSHALAPDSFVNEMKHGMSSSSHSSPLPARLKCLFQHNASESLSPLTSRSDFTLPSSPSSTSLARLDLQYNGSTDSSLLNEPGQPVSPPALISTPTTSLPPTSEPLMAVPPAPQSSPPMRLVTRSTARPSSQADTSPQPSSSILPGSTAPHDIVTRCTSGSLGHTSTGSRVEVYWPREKRLFPGEIILHCDDGGRTSVTMTAVKVGLDLKMSSVSPLLLPRYL